VTFSPLQLVDENPGPAGNQQQNFVPSVPNGPIAGGLLNLERSPLPFEESGDTPTIQPISIDAEEANSPKVRGASSK